MFSAFSTIEEKNFSCLGQLVNMNGQYELLNILYIYTEKTWKFSNFSILIRRVSIPDEKQKIFFDALECTPTKSESMVGVHQKLD